MYDRHYGERQVYAMLLRKTDGRVTIRPDVPELRLYAHVCTPLAMNRDIRIRVRRGASVKRLRPIFIKLLVNRWDIGMQTARVTCCG